MAHDGCDPRQSAPSRGGSAGQKSGNESLKRGLNTKIHGAMDGHGMPIGMLISDGTRADFSQSEQLTNGLNAPHFLAYKAYDANDIISQCKNQ